jgi:hypothetical protein
VFSARDWLVRKKINAVCPGYSGRAQWEFFKSVLAKPGVKNICILGVYRGRDMAYMASILHNRGIQDFQLTGVDRFENAYGDDWPEELRGKTWQEAGFGEPPDLAAAQNNLSVLKVLSNVRLEQDRAEHFLETTPEKFDFIYIDTAHDYDSTLKLIELGVGRLAPNGWIGGDDFSDHGTWGVASAVGDSFVNFEVFSNWLWLARDRDFSPKPVPIA